ncbi:MAG: UDP-N-acetylmuramate dehydrogenase [Clostridiales bacterium]|nr:UDP-N-acetylmuramate dehydrogenase [Clostridiales bacterium]
MSRTLSAYTSFGIGGEAKRLSVAKSAEELVSLSGDSLVLGGGSNVLVSDYGYDGTVVINRYCSYLRDGLTVTCGSGTTLPTLCAFLAEEGLSGLEWACGIPGTVGGAVTMNAGAFSHSISERLIYADVSVGGRVVRLSNDKLGFSYRSSAVTRDMTVVSACFLLDADKPSSVKARCKSYSALRFATQPKGRSAGSVFKNPEGLKIARLIDEAGLKGYRVGGAQISEKHANFIVNLGGATARDVVKIINTVKERLSENNIRAEEEIIYIGEFD